MPNTKKLALCLALAKHQYMTPSKKFLDAAIEELVPRHIKMTAIAEYESMAIDFELRWQYPMAVEAIDGCHFYVTIPSDQAVLFSLFVPQTTRHLLL